MLRFLLSGQGWPYLLVPFIPLAIVLELAHVDPIAIFAVSRGRRDPDGGADGPRHRGAGRPLRPGHRRPAQRHLRQRAGADHRALRAQRRPARGRQGVDHRLDPRQHPARAGRRDVRRRPGPRHADVRSRRRPARSRRCCCSPSRRWSCRRSSSSSRATGLPRRAPSASTTTRPSRTSRSPSRSCCIAQLRRRPALLAADAQGPLQPRATATRSTTTTSRGRCASR